MMRNHVPVMTYKWETLGLTAKELEEFGQFQHDTGLVGEALRNAWLTRPKKKELTYDYHKGGSIYSGKTFDSMGLDAFFQFMYEECIWRRRRDDEPYPSFQEWMETS